MPTSPSPLPDLPTLTRGLTSVLAGAIGRTPVSVVDRQHCRQGTFPKEIVTCRCEGGKELRLVCKYGRAQTNHISHGHRGGVAYEAAVYRRVLSRSRGPTPRCYGALTDETTTDTWLVLDYLDKGVRVTRATAPGAM